MKRLHVILMAAALAGSAGPVLADSMSMTRFKPQVMPVLVAVDAHGHVTKVMPSVELPPTLQRLLTENLDEWIRGPAVVKGRAVASQMIVNVALRTEQRKDGTYAAHFAYVSRLPSPFGGAAHWATKDGVQLALVSDSANQGFRQRWAPPPPPQYNQWPVQRSMAGPMRSAAFSGHAAARPASPPPPRGH